jgi:hypothetical protein
MNKQLKAAIDMIAQGYDLNLVLNITQVDPELLMDVLTSMLGDEQATVTVVQTLQHFDSKEIGMFKVNVN